MYHILVVADRTSIYGVYMLLRHHALKDVIARACASAGVPVFKEPSGLFPGDIRRPDGITLIPWQAGKALAWDATVTSTLADSYIHQSATTAEMAAELAAARKVSKYLSLIHI